MMRRLSAFHINVARRWPALAHANETEGRARPFAPGARALSLPLLVLGVTFTTGCEQTLPSRAAEAAQVELRREALKHGECVGTSCEDLPGLQPIEALAATTCNATERTGQVSWWAQSGKRPCILDECDSALPKLAANASGKLWVKSEVVNGPADSPTPVGLFVGAYDRDGQLKRALDVPVPPTIGSRIYVEGHGVDNRGRVRWVAPRGNTHAVDLRVGRGNNAKRHHLVDNVTYASGRFSPEGALYLLHLGESAPDSWSPSINLASFDARGVLLWNQTTFGDYYDAELLGVGEAGVATLLGHSFDGPELVRVGPDGQVQARHLIDLGPDGYLNSAEMAANGDVYLTWEVFAFVDDFFESATYLDRVSGDGELLARIDLEGEYAPLAGTDASGRAILTWGFGGLRRFSLDGSECEDLTFDSEIFEWDENFNIPFFCSDWQCGPIQVVSAGEDGLYAAGPAMIARLEVGP